MPTFVHAVTGVSVNVSDETAANLGTEWAVPVKSESEDKPARRTGK